MPEIRHSVCALDCPDSCSLLINVDRTATAPNCAAIRRIRSRAASSAAKWRSTSSASTRPSGCSIRSAASAPKAKAASSASPGTKRSTRSPHACDAIAAEFGPESILPYSYAGTMGLLNGAGMDRRFFHRLGASRLDRTICSAAGMAGPDRGARRALRHRARAVPPREADHRLGREHPRHQRPPLAVHRGSAAQRREVLHDRSASATAPARLADRHYSIHPGSDAALALAHDARHHRRRSGRRAITSSATRSGFDELRERVARMDARSAPRNSPASPPRTSSQLAREYATTRPAAIRLNYGVQRSERGAMAVRAIALLPALTGLVEGRRAAACSSPLRRRSTSTARAWSGPICSSIAAAAAKRASSTCRNWARR